MRYTILLLLTLCFVVGCASARSIKVVPGEYVITAQGPWCEYKSGQCPWNAESKGQAPTYGAGVYSIEESGAVRLIKTNDVSALSVADYDEEKDLCLTTFKNERCSPNYVLEAETNDTLYKKLWALDGENSANIVPAWNKYDFGSSVFVGVVDSGVDCEHEDLPECVAEFNAITDKKGKGAAYDDNGHGTHVAGTIASVANNKLGVAGVCQNCKIIAAKFLSANGSGTLYNAIKSIDFISDYAKAHGVRIIANNSWGGGGYSAPLRDSIKRASDSNVLFVAAAGNESSDNEVIPHYPSDYDVPNIISVGATTHTGSRAWFSNYGETAVDIAAPGDGIWSTLPGNKYGSKSGTSMAAPHVTGVAALLASQYPSLSALEIKDVLIKNSKKVSKLKKSTFEGSFLDAMLALEHGTSCNKKEWKKCRTNCAEAFMCNYKKQKACRAGCKNYWCKGE